MKENIQQNIDRKLPCSVGISLKAQHYQEVLDSKPDVGWFEVHPENYMGAGGLPHKFLAEVHQHYPLSMHGVGLSLGSADGIETNHLSALKSTVDKHQPQQVSEHLAWSHWNQTFLNDLLPFPYTGEFLEVVIRNVELIQETLQQKILIENPSAYLAFTDSYLNETEFLQQVCQRTGCGLLLDVNNVYVSAKNQDFSTENYLAEYPMEYVGEIHLAGHAQDSVEGKTLLIDDHGSPVIDTVWDLFSQTLALLKKPCPALIEWDTNIPELQTLVEEAKKAEKLIAKVLAEAV